MATILLDTSVIFDHLNDRHGRTAFPDIVIEEVLKGTGTVGA